MQFSGIIFDFNGVLWWDTPLQEAAWRQFSAEIRGTPLSATEITIHVHGRTNQHTLAYVSGQPITGADLTRLTQHKEGIYRHLCLQQAAEFKLSPQAIELLDYLVVNNIPHTIATASEKTNLDFFIEHLALEKWFDLEQIVFDDGERAGKPDPAIYREAAQRLGLKPAQCIVVEDSYSGLESAVAAKIGHVVALGNIETHAQLHAQNGVNQVVEHLGELLTAHLF